MSFIAACPYFIRVRALFVLFSLGLTGCALQRNDVEVSVHDFGPGVRHIESMHGRPALPTLELAPVQASAALGGTALLYRLMYVNAQQPRPYAHARWSVPAAQLVDQRLRERLGLHRAVVQAGAVAPGRSTGDVQPVLATLTDPGLLRLQVDLEEFSQLFDAPEHSSALVRLRATVLAHSATGDALLAQRSFIAQHNARTADAAGGVQALTVATDQAITELETWLAQWTPSPPAR